MEARLEITIYMKRQTMNIDADQRLSRPGVNDGGVEKEQDIVGFRAIRPRYLR